ncbi:MAG: hypothetical protein ACTSRP_14285 [Candidatus Helarchaeota archaeon]
MKNQEFYDQFSQKFDKFPLIVKYENNYRKQLIIKTLKDFNLTKNLSILEIGSGTGLISLEIIKHLTNFCRN